jgi:hypothetical protein
MIQVAHRRETANTPPSLHSCAGAFHADASAVPCGLFAVAFSGNGQDYEPTPYSVFVHERLAIGSIVPPCACIQGGTLVTVDFGQSLHVAACNPLVLLSSCDAAIPAKLSADGRQASFTMPAVARASASHTLKFSANAGGCWTAAKEFPLFGE